MSWTEHVRSLAEYNQWANGKVLAACEGLSDEELRRDRGASRGSISALLWHIGQVEAGWFSRASGTEMEPVCQPVAPLEELGEVVERVDAKMVEWAKGATEEALAEEVRFGRPGEDVEYKAIAWQPLTTLFVHSTQHRAEIGMMLAAVDRSPGDLDFVYFGQETKLGFLEVE